jgi:hypothetical protein
MNRTTNTLSIFSAAVPDSSSCESEVRPDGPRCCRCRLVEIVNAVLHTPDNRRALDNTTSAETPEHHANTTITGLNIVVQNSRRMLTKAPEFASTAPGTGFPGDVVGTPAHRAAASSSRHQRRSAPSNVQSRLKKSAKIGKGGLEPRLLPSFEKTMSRLEWPPVGISVIRVPGAPDAFRSPFL